MEDSPLNWMEMAVVSVSIDSVDDDEPVAVGMKVEMENMRLAFVRSKRTMVEHLIVL